MTLHVFSASDSFNQYVKKVSQSEAVCYSKLLTVTNEHDIYLIHAASIATAYEVWMQKHKSAKCIICADHPNLIDMLSATKAGAKAYCNSYMQGVHYRQMLNLVNTGQSWFPPQLLEETFNLAAQVINANNKEARLTELTEKEKQISLSIAQGHSNKEIAALLDIKETTVKTHLTHIYKKLDIKDRVALILHMNQS